MAGTHYLTLISPILYALVIAAEYDGTDWEVPCAKPEPPANGRIHVRGGQWRIYFYCDEGYRLDGPVQVDCNASGLWEPPDIPRCKEATVCRPPPIENGRALLLQARYYPGSSTKVVCDEGFRNERGNEITCRDDGTWQNSDGSLTGRLAACIEMTCPAPAPLPSGSLEVEGVRAWDGGYKLGSLALYQCNPGYRLLEYASSQRVCRNSLWSGPDPVCVKTGCDQPEEVENGYYVALGGSLWLGGSGEDRVYTTGNSVRYMCHQRYLLIGADVYHCMADGLWSPPVPPMCRLASQISALETMCSVPEEVNYAAQKVVKGWVNRQGASEGTVVEYMCLSGTRDVISPCHPQQLVCQGGVWVGSLPKCETYSSCDKPPPLENGRVFVGENSHRFGEQVLYTCNDGHQLVGPSMLQCERSGCWAPRLPPICRFKEDVRDSLSSSVSSSLLTTRTVSIVTACSVTLLLLLLFVIIVLLQRKNLTTWIIRTTSRPQGPVTPPPAAQEDPDRVALIAFAEGVQVVLPSYEEAMREHAPPPYLDINFQSLHRGLRPHRTLPPPVRRSRRQRDVDNSDSVSHHSIQSHQSSARQSSNTSHSNSIHNGSVADSMGSTDTMATSDVSTNVTVETLSSNMSYTPSVRAMCGSLASFDTNSVLNTEGVPLLEEKEGELEQPDSDEAEDRLSGREGSITDSVSK